MSQPGKGLKQFQMALPKQNKGDKDEGKLSKLLTERSYKRLVQFSESVITCHYNPKERVSSIGERRPKYEILTTPQLRRKSNLKKSPNRNGLS